MHADIASVLHQEMKKKTQITDEEFKVEDAEAFLHGLPVPRGHSSRWLLSHEEVTSWMSIQPYRHKVIWLHGSPGSGKTILLRDLSLHLISQTYEVDEKAPTIRKPILFFFDDKQVLRNSSLEFVRSAIVQIRRDKRMEFSARHLDLYNSFRLLRHEPEDAWWKLLHTVIQRSRGVLFLFVIDAIDEVLRNVPVNTVTIIDRLQELLSVDLSGRVRLLVSDRKKRVYGFQPEDIATIEVDNDITTSSVNDFVRTRLRRGFEMSDISPRAGKDVERTIIDIAQGNFLHANLALEQFASNVQQWDRNQIAEGLRRLKTLSHDLVASYCRLLAQIAPPYRRRAKASFAVLRVCRERLTLRQLAFFATLYEALHTSPKPTASLSLKDLLHQCGDFEYYMTGALGYIIKAAANGTVSFAHVSVKDLFAKMPNPELLLPEHVDVLEQFITPEAGAHSILQNLCFVTLQLEDRSSEDWVEVLENMESVGLDPTQRGSQLAKSIMVSFSKTPCMAYAVSHSLGHFQESSAIATIDLDAISVLHSPMGYVCYVLWLCLNDISHPTPLIMPEISHEPSLAHETSSDAVLSRILARGDFPRLVQCLLAKGANANNSIGMRLKGDNKANGASLLSWAILCQQRESFDLLLRHDTTQINSGPNYAPRPLHFAIDCRDTLYFASKLIQHPQCNINITYHNPNSVAAKSRQDEGTPLYLAYRRMNIAAVELLLGQPYVDIWTKGGTGESPYSMTFKYGMWHYLWEKILKLSGKTTEDILAENISGISRIVAAGVYGWTELEEKILFENPRQLLAVDPDTKMSPLTTYAYFGRRDKLLWILDRLPTDFPLRDQGDQYDLLHLCAHHGWEDVVHLLQQRFGLTSLESDHTGRTLLHWAIEHFWDMERMDLTDFSSPSNLIDKRDRDGLTALHLAVVARNIQAVKALLAAGADGVLADKHGNTPAHLAADLGFRAALDVFIDREERESGRTRSGASLLHLISMWFDGETVDRFVRAKSALVNVADKQRLTPLHYAAIANNLSAIEVLVHLGCAIDARSASRTTPLHEAIRSGSVGAALLLLKFGADYHAADGFRQNCLHLSCRYGHDELIHRLLRLGCDITAIDVFGMHLLHRVCASNKDGTVLQLLKAKADWRAKDKYRRSALDLAVQNQAVQAATVMVDWLYRYHPRSHTRRRLFDKAVRVACSDNRSLEIKMLLHRYGARHDEQSTNDAPQEDEAWRRAKYMQVVLFDEVWRDEQIDKAEKLERERLERDQSMRKARDQKEPMKRRERR